MIANKLKWCIFIRVFVLLHVLRWNLLFWPCVYSCLKLSLPPCERWNRYTSEGKRENGRGLRWRSLWCVFESFHIQTLMYYLLFFLCVVTSTCPSIKTCSLLPTSSPVLPAPPLNPASDEQARTLSTTRLTPHRTPSHRHAYTTTQSNSIKSSHYTSLHSTNDTNSIIQHEHEQHQ